MADILQNLDPKNLVNLETVLSFVISPFSSPSYNFPLFLFGIYSQESVESNQPLKLFAGLLGGSILWDIIWMARNGQNWFIRLISIIVLILKIPTALAFVTALRQRGEQFGGLNIRGSDLSGATVWSMPGGFSSLAGGRNGYENVDGERDVEAHPKSVPATQTPTSASVSAVPPNPPSGGYQTM